MPSEAMSRIPPLTRADGDAPAWYGKIPGAGDFVNSRLPHALALWWERWLQQGLAAMRQRGPDEIARHYTVAPVWNFLVPAGAGNLAIDESDEPDIDVEENSLQIIDAEALLRDE